MNTQFPGETYRSSGVDIEAGDKFVDSVKSLAIRTKIPEIIAGIGGFAGCCLVPTDLQEPVLVSGTDGVGTKLKVAFLTGKHDTVGIDLVAMCINDVITTGARPLFFLDYFATGKLDLDQAQSVVRGIVEGCVQAECALIGGETAEMPGIYAEGEYDLAGFAVGVVDRKKMVTGNTIEKGDSIIGIASSGLHSNGYSLARKIFFERAGWNIFDGSAQLGAPLGEILLCPTKIYAKAVKSVLATGAVRGMCHITGGGLPGNVPRVLPPNLGVELNSNYWPHPRVFDVIKQLGGVSQDEMFNTFNMGIGFIVIVDPQKENIVLQSLFDSGETAWKIGVVIDSVQNDFIIK